MRKEEKEKEEKKEKEKKREEKEEKEKEKKQARVLQEANKLTILSVRTKQSGASQCVFGRSPAKGATARHLPESSPPSGNPLPPRCHGETAAAQLRHSGSDRNSSSGQDTGEARARQSARQLRWTYFLGVIRGSSLSVERDD